MSYIQWRTVKNFGGLFSKISYLNVTETKSAVSKRGGNRKPALDTGAKRGTKSGLTRATGNLNEELIFNKKNAKIFSDQLSFCKRLETSADPCTKSTGNRNTSSVSPVYYRIDDDSTATDCKEALRLFAEPQSQSPKQSYRNCAVVRIDAVNLECSSNDENVSRQVNEDVVLVCGGTTPKVGMGSESVQQGIGEVEGVDQVEMSEGDNIEQVVILASEVDIAVSAIGDIDNSEWTESSFFQDVIPFIGWASPPLLDNAEEEEQEEELEDESEDDWVPKVTWPVGFTDESENPLNDMNMYWCMRRPKRSQPLGAGEEDLFPSVVRKLYFTVEEEKPWTDKQIRDRQDAPTQWCQARGDLDYEDMDRLAWQQFILCDDTLRHRFDKQF